MTSSGCSFRRSAVHRERQAGRRNATRRSAHRLGVLLLLALLAAPGCRKEPQEITILGINDFHGALAQGGIDAKSGRPWGGARALASRIREQRRLHPRRTFLLDAGDTMQGTAESNLFAGRSSIELMNRLEVDAMSLGNHEFDWGIDTLRARIAEMHYPILAANVFDRDGRRPPWLRAFTLVERDGVRLGVIGFVTPDTPRVTYPPFVADLRFDAPEQLVQALVDSVRAQGAQIVVVLCHVGARQDSTGAINGPLVDLARAARGVDAIVGGHIHTRVAGHVAGIPLVVAATKGRALGRIVLHWDGQRVVDSDAQLLETYADSLPGPPDARVVALLDSISERVRPFVSRVLGRTGRRLGPELLANLVTDAMCRASGAEIAVSNIGSVRTDLQPGDITVGQLFEVVPFENTLVTSRLTGAQLDAFLESCPTAARVSGMRMRLGPREAADRVHLEDTKGRPLDPDRTYLVVTNNFIAYGGDGFRGFLDGSDVTWTPLLVRQAVQDWMLGMARDGVVQPDTTLRVLPARELAGSRP